MKEPNPPKEDFAVEEKVYKFGLIGCGRWGKNIIKTVEGMENIKITHLVTSKAKNVKLISNKVNVFRSHLDLCQTNYIDGVIIATPPSTHAEILRDCVYHLFPVMVEKPFCLNLAESIDLRDYVNGSKVPCMVDYTQLFNPAYVELCKRFKSQKPKTIESKVCSYGPFRPDVPMIWDWAPHDIAMVLNLLKEMPKKIRATHIKHENYPNSGEIEINMEFRSTTVKININNLSAKKYRAFIGTSSFQTMTMFGEELYEGRSDRIFPIQVPSMSPLQCALNGFIETIETNVCFGVNLSVDVAKIIEKCQKSIETDKEVNC